MILRDIQRLSEGAEPAPASSKIFTDVLPTRPPASHSLLLPNKAGLSRLGSKASSLLCGVFAPGSEPAPAVEIPLDFAPPFQ